MTRFRTFSLVVLVWLLAALPSRVADAQARNWKEIPKSPLAPFQIPKPTRIELPNGMVIFLMEDHELPLIDGFAYIKAGSRNEPAEKAGLGRIVGGTWRTGGTQSRLGDELDDFLEARAAKVETSLGMTSAIASLSCLKGDFEDALKIFAEVIREPRFAQDKIEIAKNQVSTEIARRNDEPMQVAEREARKLVYGANSPYARTPEYATVASVTREDLLAWHRKYVHPDRVLFGLVGDFDSRKMETLLRKTFEAWPKGPAVADPEPAYQESPKPGVYFVEKEDVNQSNIRLVHLGTTKKNPDFFALEVANEIFGGGFASRLFSNVRSKKGLAYAVWGGVGTQYDYPGIFQAAMGTKSGTTAGGIDALYEEVENIVKNPATAEELQRAKDSILNSFIFRYDSKGKILREQVTDEFYGYPLDFLDRYRAGIEKVTAEDVARVAKKYIHRDQIAVLVVGKSADFDRPLSAFGSVTKLDISISAPGAPKPQATSESKEGGKALFARVVEGLGGAEKVAATKDLRRKGKATTKTPQGEMALDVTEVLVLPDRVYQQMQMPFGTMTMVSAPGAAFLSGPMGTQDLPPSMKEELAKELHRSPLFLAQRTNDPKLSVTTGGREKIGNLEAAILDVSYEGAEVRWFIDPATGRIVRTSHTAMGRSGPGTSVTDYSDFRAVSGLTLPFQSETSVNGEKSQTMSVEEIQINSTPDPKLFEKPPAKSG